MRELLEILMEELPELIYISDPHTYELLYLNEAGRRAFGELSPDGSSRCYRVLQGLEEPCPFCTNDVLGHESFYSWEITNPLTNRHYLLRDKLITWRGRESRIEIAFDLTEKEEERARFAYLATAGETVVECIKRLSENEDTLAAINGALTLMGGVLDADRTYVFAIHEDRMNNIAEWCAPGVEPEIHLLQNLPLSLIDRWRLAFSAHKPMIIEQVEGLKRTSPEEYDILSLQGIDSLVAVPLESDGELLGYLGVDNPNMGKADDIAAPLMSLAYFMSSTMQRERERHVLEMRTWGDMLTNVHSRTAFYRDYGADPLRRVGLVEADVDEIRLVNVTKGREAGDALLVTVADKLAEAYGRERVYRTGDDEFVAIVTDVDEAAFVSDALALSRRLDAQKVPVTLGYAWQQTCLDVRSIANEVDEKLKQMKQMRARARSAGWKPWEESGAGTLLRPGGAAEAVAKGAVSIHVQPQVDQDDQVVSAEALVRYADPETGELVPPLTYIPALEDMGEVSVIDFHVLDLVCDLLVRWRACGYVDDGFSVATNFSRRTAEDAGFIERVVSVVAEHGLPPSCIEVEITESARESDSQEPTVVVNRLREEGFRVAIDDFGVDNANVSLFASMRISTLKLDQSLVDCIGSNDWGAAIVESIVRLCADLDVTTVAEGVESPEQLALLRAMGCARIQGFLTGRPVTVEAFERRWFA